MQENNRCNSAISAKGKTKIHIKDVKTLRK